MDIVDAQVHIEPGRLEPTLAAMDALGIRSALIDEFWQSTAGDIWVEGTKPGYRTASGGWRAIYPVAQIASRLHPDRFAFIVRVDRIDDDLETVMRLIAAEPHAKGFRLLPAFTLAEAQGFIAGSYDALLDIAQDIGLPVALFIPGYVEHLPRYLERYPRLQFILDHVGMGVPGLPPGRDADETARTTHADYFAQVLNLAQYPNIAMKLSQMPNLLAGGAFPFAPVRTHLRAAIERFGVQRLMWASDYTVLPYGWDQLLEFIRLDPELSDEEKAWLLGRTARTIMNWPA